jgi:hypothetical protein
MARSPSVRRWGVAVDGLDFSVLGPALLVLATLALLVLRKRPDVVVRGERLPFWSAFGRVAPCGLGLTLASIGYGTLTTFVTLYYRARLGRRGLVPECVWCVLHHFAAAVRQRGQPLWWLQRRSPAWPPKCSAWACCGWRPRRPGRWLAPG